MGISSLNSFFTKHHRIIFGVFAILIIVAFVFADFIGGGGGGCSMFGSTSRVDQPAAEIFGEKTSVEGFEEQYRLTQLDIFMTYNGARLPEEYVRQLAFQRLTAQALAKRYNIVISDEDVAQQLFRSFAGKDGKFDKEAYQKFLDNFLLKQGFTENDLNEVFRHQLLVQKLADIYSNTAPVSESELKAFYNMMNQELDIYMAIVEIKNFEPQVKVDDKALNEFFSQNRAMFTMPAILNAIVVKFDPAQYTAQVKVDEKEVRTYYDANKEYMYKVKDKDGKETVTPFDEVKAQITEQLKMQKALEIAREEAGKFSLDVYEMISASENQNYADVFKKYAADKKFKVITTGRFNANADKAGAVGGAALVRELAATDRELPLTEAVNDVDASYVGFVVEYTPARQAEYKEVTEQVKTQYIRAEAAKLAQQQAEKLAAELREMKAADRAKKLADKDYAFKPFGNVTVLDLLNQQSQIQSQLNMMQQFNMPPEMLSYQLQAANVQLSMIQLMLDMNAGDVSTPQSNPIGYQIIHVAARKAPAKPFEATDQLRLEYKSFKANNANFAFSAFTRADSQMMVAETAEEAEQTAE